MKNHTQIFQDFWWDELTLAQTEQCFMNGEDDDCKNFDGTNVHHIKKRQSGGNKNLEIFECDFSFQLISNGINHQSYEN